MNSIDKLDFLLNFFFKNKQFDGNEMSFREVHEKATEQGVYNEINNNEFSFYFATLIERQFVRVFTPTQDEVYPTIRVLNGLFKLKTNWEGYFVRLTIIGIERIEELLQSGADSNKCFIAMSFDENDKRIFDEALKPACETHGFDAVRVDGLHADSTQTINDLIISTLKTCRFCIADFTQFKNGVYFEAGYAAGRGMKVIYTCPESEKDNLHFDVKHFQFILYKDLADLKEKLTNKIGAYIVE